MIQLRIVPGYKHRSLNAKVQTSGTTRFNTKGGGGGYGLRASAVTHAGVTQTFCVKQMHW
jgi:hypothetical protein